MAANVPLVESGTAGYLGQVQPIVKVNLFDVPGTALDAKSRSVTGPDGMLRLHSQAYSEDVPSMHYPLHTVSADSLHCVGEKLPSAVSEFRLWFAPY